MGGGLGGAGRVVGCFERESEGRDGASERFFSWDGRGKMGERDGKGEIKRKSEKIFCFLHTNDLFQHAVGRGLLPQKMDLTFTF